MAWLFTSSLYQRLLDVLIIIMKLGGCRLRRKRLETLVELTHSLSANGRHGSKVMVVWLSCRREVWNDWHHHYRLNLFFIIIHICFEVSLCVALCIALDS